MFGAISGLIANLGARAGLAELGADSGRLALAALLAYVAAVDGVVKDSETKALETLLADRFALGRSAARQLISAAHKAEEEEESDFSAFAAGLKRSLDPQERAAVIGLMWTMARADGHVHEFEEALIARVEQLLEVASAR